MNAILLFSLLIFTGLVHAEDTIAQQGYSLLSQGRYADAGSVCQKPAEHGNLTCQTILGVLYDFGQGWPQDYNKAAYWYTKAAMQGNPTAQGNLGYLYHQGTGVAKDDNQAVYWYIKSAEQGYVDAQVNLGFMYKNGLGTSQDYKKAIYWFKQAADKENVIAQSNLDIMYDNGQGTQKEEWGTMEDVLRDSSENINKTLPMKLNRNMTILGTTPGPGALFTYIYRLSKDVLQGASKSSYLASNKPYLIKSFCTDPDTMIFFQYGITVRLSFSIETGEFIGNINITPKDCGFNK